MLKPSAYFVKAMGVYAHQLFIYDEHEILLESLEPGDFILARNVRCAVPNGSEADVVLRMPTQGAQFHRTIIVVLPHKALVPNGMPIKLAPAFAANMNVTLLVQETNAMASKLGARLIAEAEFKAEYGTNHMPDESFDEATLMQRLKGMLRRCFLF